MQPSSLIQTDKKKRKLNNFMKLYPDKVPIWMTYKLQKKNQQKQFAIDLDNTFYQFQENMKAKFLYEGLDKKKVLFFYIKYDKNQQKKGILVNNQYTKMADIYDQYRNHQGWLQINVGIQSGFGNL